MKNQPGAQEFKLFETGCCLCGVDCETVLGGMSEPYKLSSSRANGHARVCSACRNPHKSRADSIGFAWADAEITRRKASPPAESRAEMPEDVRELLTEARKHRPEAVIELVMEGEYRYAIVWASEGGGYAASFAFSNNFERFWENGIRNDRGSIAAAIANAAIFPLEDAKKLVEPGKSPGASSHECSDGERKGYGANVCPRGCDYPKKPDPYAKSAQDEGVAFADTNYDNRQIAKERIAALSTSASPLDRLAARKQRQRAEVLADISRPWTYRDRMGVERTWDGRRVKP